MKRIARALAVWLALGLTPAASFAASAPGGNMLTFATHFVPESPAGAGGYDGTLKLRIDPSGIIDGIYRPNGSGPFVQVSGGLSGDRIWLDLGNGRGGRITGRYRNGWIVGGTFVHGRPWDFSATPVTTHD